MKTLSKVYKILLCVVILAAIAKEVIMLYPSSWIVFLYFTIQSNILVVVYLLISLFHKEGHKAMHQFRGITLLAITLTGLVFNFVLHNIFTEWGTHAYMFSRTVTHIVAPIGFILDWVFFDKHGFFTIRHAFLWLLYPFVYCVATLYLGYISGKAIYFFFNPASGYGYIAFWLMILVAVTLCISLGFVGLDRLLMQTKTVRIESDTDTMAR